MTGPLSHNAPFVATAAGMLLGNHGVLMSRFDPAQTLRLIQKHRVSWLYLVPTMMLRIWRLPEAIRLAADVSSLEVAFHVAAPCPPWLKQASAVMSSKMPSSRASPSSRIRRALTASWGAGAF